MAADCIERKAVLNALYDAGAITMAGVAIINNFPSVNKPEEKEWEPKEAVTMTLAKEDWLTITQSLENWANQAHASMSTWLYNLEKNEYTQETAEKYKRTHKSIMELLERVNMGIGLE